jgi:antitoxin component YwqK of YwqJK toxin-antitoxin module
MKKIAIYRIGEVNMIGIHLRKWVYICIVVVLLASFGKLNQAWAAVTFNTSDTATSYTATFSSAQIAGNDMVWMTKDSLGWGQIYYRNLETGTIKQLTDTKTEKSEPGLGGDYAIYMANKREVVAINIRTGESAVISSGLAYIEDHPTTDGRFFAYVNKVDGSIYVYDKESQKTKKIGNGLSPVVFKGKLLYVENDKLQFYNLFSGETRTLWTTKDGSIREFAFNGKTAVWIQSLMMGGYQARMLQIDEQDSIPSLLASFDEKYFFKSIVIGDDIAAWVQPENGINQIAVADLASSKSQIVTSGTDKKKLVGIYKNQVMFQGSDGKIVLRAIKMSGTSDTPAATIASAVPDVSPMPKGISSAAIGIDDKELATSDGSIKLKSKEAITSTLPGSFSLEPQLDKDLNLTKALLPGQKMVSLPWSVEFSVTESELELSMSYIKSRISPEQKNKLGIYRLESGSWTYMGGLFEKEDNRIYTTIMKSGIYTVLSYDVANSNVRDYWTNKRIYQYTANDPIRVFLDGEEVNFREPPLLKDGFTTVEFKPIFEKLGLQIKYDAKTQTVSGNKEGDSLSLTIGKTKAVTNGHDVELPLAPFINKNYTFVPIRYVAEATGRKALWDANLKAVYMYDLATVGKLYYPNGTLKYEGQLNNGHMNGKGKLYREDGSLWYDAEFKNDAATGWGTIYFAGFSRGRDRTGEMAIGQFQDGIPQGYVRNIDDSGYIAYEGQVIQGIFNGKGKYFIENQLIYDGEFKDNLYYGHGKYYVNGKLKYDGDFVNNDREGYGKEYNKEGLLSYEGEYKQDLKKGKGTWFYNSGEKMYEGDFAFDAPDGQGKEYYSDGQLKHEGQFKNGSIVNGTLYYPNDERYEGEFAGDLPDGQGTLYDKAGNVRFQGKFARGNPVK